MYIIIAKSNSFLICKVLRFWLFSRDSNLTTSVICLWFRPCVHHQNPIHLSNQSPFSRINFLINQLSHQSTLFIFTSTYHNFSSCFELISYYYNWTYQPHEYYLARKTNLKYLGFLNKTLHLSTKVLLSSWLEYTDIVKILMQDLLLESPLIHKTVLTLSNAWRWLLCEQSLIKPAGN